MNTKAPVHFDTRKKLLTRIVTTQKQADAAKKAAKLAKLALRGARQKSKDAKRAAKKLRKAVKELKAELASLAATATRNRKRPASKPTARRVRSVGPVVATSVNPPPFDSSPASEVPPGAPAQ